MYPTLRFLSVLLLSLLLTIEVSSQAPEFSWVTKFGGTANDMGHSISVDNLGYTYLTGEFRNIIDFGGGFVFDASGTGRCDYYLVKLNPSGSTVWAVKGGGTLTNRGFGLTIDQNGNIYTTGHYFGQADFSGTILTSAGNLDNIVAKYDPSGNLLWIRDGKSVSQVSSRGIALDASGNVFVSGYFGSATVDSVNFDGLKVVTNGQRDVFLAKYNNAGIIQWAANGGGPLSGEEGRSVAVDPTGNPIMVGMFADTATFSGTQLFTEGGNDIFVVKYSSNGNLIWARSAGGLGGDAAEAVGVDNQGNIYVTGYFDSVATFGSIQVNGIDRDEVFLAKMTSNGSFTWVVRAGGTLIDRGNDLYVTPDGYSYITGRFNGTAAFGSTNITSAGDNDIFVAKYDTDGNLLWVKRAGGTGSDYGNAIAVDVVGNAYVSGFFNQTASFDGFNFSSAGGNDIFIGKLGNVPIPVELSAFNATVINGNVKLNWTTVTEVNNAGFDIERSNDNLQFDKIAFIEGNGTTSELQNYSYTDNSVLNGNYYYRLRQVDFDGSFSYSQVVEVEIGVPTKFEVYQNYPNPFNPETQITFALPVSAEITITVYNLLGQAVAVPINEFKDAGKYSFTFNASSLTSGTYFYSVEAKSIDGSVNSSVKKMTLLK